MAPRLSRVPLLLAALLSCQEALAQIVTETSYVTTNDVTTLYTCAPSALPLCNNVVWSAASTESTDTTPTDTGTGTGTGQATVTETETEGGTTDTVTSVDISTEVESVTETITEFTSSSASATASTVPTLIAGEPVTLSLTDANGNPLLLVTDPNGIVRFVSATSPDAANAQQVFADAQGVFHLVSDPNSVIYFGVPSAGRRGRMMRRQNADIDPNTMAMLVALQSSLGPNDAIVAWNVDASGNLVCSTSDGKVLDLYFDPATGQAVPVPQGETPTRPGLVRAAAAAQTPTTTQAVTGAPLTSFTFSFVSSGAVTSSSTSSSSSSSSVSSSTSSPSSTSSSSSVSSSSSSSSSSADPLTTIITSYGDFCSTLLGHVTVTTIQTAATPTSYTGSLTTYNTFTTTFSSVVLTTDFVTTGSDPTQFNPTNTSPPAGAKVVRAQRRKRQATTPAALTSYSASALSSACSGFIGSAWMAATTTIATTPAATTVTTPDYQYSYTTLLTTTVSTSFTSTQTSYTSTLTIGAMQTANVKIATGTGANIQYLVFDVAGVSAAKYPLKLGALADASTFSIDNYGRISHSYSGSGSAVDYFLQEATAGTPAANKAWMAVAGTAGYWLSFYYYGTTNQLFIDPQRNNPATAGQSATGNHLFLMCTFTPTTYAQLAFGVTTNTNTAGTGCAATTFYLTV
ncbi:hypothetical protein TWF506_004443 [Arthrobotrys conoides]|uniref:Uncharacterized protein n=1 Tax=Arthrobotrys conoides TaxID=74498 RepID=A0AAN8RIL1_9PEZI